MHPKSFQSMWYKTLLNLKNNNLTIYNLFIKKVREKRLDPYSPTVEVLKIYHSLLKK